MLKNLNVFKMALRDIRIKYNDKCSLLLESDIQIKDPFILFEKWFDDAKNIPEIKEPHAVFLATATSDGKPSGRMVLCKGYSREGFSFFTHYMSRKGEQLAENPYAALTYFWASLSRQIRIEGTVEKLPSSVSEEYFKSRPYDNQIGTACSEQSKVIEGRHILTTKANDLRANYGEGEVPKPQNWGGYFLKPNRIEFWHGQTDRIHDRILFRRPSDNEPIDEILTHKGSNGWVYERLSP